MSLGRIGLILTVIYLIAVAAAVFYFWPTFSTLSPNTWGDFLAGAFGPPTLAWVVLGFLLQGKELANSVKALEVQSEELRNSVEEQRRIAEISGAQFKLQQEEFQSAIRRLDRLDQPDFVLRYSGITRGWPRDPIYGSFPVEHGFELSNIGNTATHISITTGYGELEGKELEVVIWPQFKTSGFRLLLYADDTHGDTIQIWINYSTPARETKHLEYSFTRKRSMDPTSFILSGPN